MIHSTTDFISPVCTPVRIAYSLAKKKDKQVILNMASGLVLTLSNLAIFFFITPFMRDQLENELFGAWSFIGTLIGYAALLQSTTTTAMTKYVAEYKAQNNQEKLLLVINSGLAQYLLLSAITLVTGSILCYLTGFFPKLQISGYLTTIRITFGLMVLNLVLDLPFIGIRATLAGLHRYVFLNTLQLIRAIAYAGGTVLVLLRGWDLIGLALCDFVLCLIVNCISYIFLRRILSFKLSFRYCRWDMIKLIFNFGIFSFISSFSTMIFYYTDNLVMGCMISLTMITVYQFGFKILESLKKLNISATSVLMPVASEISILTGEERRRKLEELFTRGSRFSAILTLPPILFLLIFGKEFFRFWLGIKYEYVDQTYWIFVILIVPHTFVFSQYVGPNMLVGLAKHHAFAYILLGLALLNLGLSILFAYYWGIYGIALGTAIPITLSRPIMHFYFKRVFDISMKKYYWNVWSRLIPIAAVLTGFLILCKFTITISNMPALVSLAAGYAFFFWLLSYWTLDSYERQVIQHILRKITGKTPATPPLS